MVIFREHLTLLEALHVPSLLLDFPLEEALLMSLAAFGDSPMGSGELISLASGIFVSNINETYA